MTASSARALHAGRDGCCVLIAVKQREACKTRLSAALPQSGRMTLVRSMLEHVLRTARAARSARQVIVLTPERDTLPADVPVLADIGTGLNAALRDAHRVLLGLGVRELLVLPADLPTIAAVEIDHLVHTGRRAGCAIAPDMSGLGTNALYLCTDRVFGFQFGEDSSRRHMLESQRLGLAVRQVRLPGLAFDVDRPADLQRLKRIREAECLQ